MLSDVSNSWRIMKATESVCVLSTSNMLLRYESIIINCKWVYSRWQCATMQRGTIQYSTIQYNTMRIIQYNTIQYCIIQYDTV